ncbi:MAG: VCBS repeat-containing protein [Saprospiraceae bacterium]|nr:VCBS repeat-containing protein [Saprospiraceae bacterium]
MSKLSHYILLTACICIFSCQNDNNTSDSTDSNTPKSGFEIIESSTSGLTFENTLVDDPMSDKNVLSYQHYFNGAGVGVADFNQDGLQDVFFAGNEVPNRLYINKGSFKFEELPASSGINIGKTWASGVSIVDINADGFPDIYVCQQGPYPADKRKNLFYINNGDLTFTERASEMGLDDDNYSTQACFIDYDKDGDLDCYVMNESKYAGVILKTVYDELKDEGNMRRASGKLFRNNGNLKFTDVTKESGVLNYGYGLGLAVSDFNGDNWPDIYVANDYTVPDFMYINQKDGTFKESIKDYTRQISYFAMGCDVADINNDGLVDIGVVDMAAEDHERDKTLMAGMDVEAFHYYFNQRKYQLQYMFNSLQLNNGNNTFSNIAALAGVLKSDWSWSAIFSDFNLDSHKDYYVSNGFRRYSRDNDFRNLLAEVRDKNNGTVPLSKRKELYELMPEIKLKNKLYINDGNLYFDDKNKSFTHPNLETYSYGVAQADFDNDGDIDLIMNNIDQPVLLLKNNARENLRNNFLKITLNEPDASKKYNSKISIHYNGKQQMQEYYFIRGYESTMQECLFFGLGDVSKIDKLQIIWPDGNVQLLENIDANQTLDISYKKEKNKPIANQVNTVFQQLEAKDKGIDFNHKENTFDDFQKEILLPQKQSAFGPALAKGDINNDGLEDLYFGGAKGQAGTLYTQNKNGSFKKHSSQPWQNEFMSEDVDAVFIDANNDEHKDLIILSGGSGDFVGEESLLADRFYANNGKGEFFRIANVLPTSYTASYSIIAKNIDEDPEEELIIIGAAKPGKYPQKETTVIYDYQEKAYTDVTETLIPSLNDQNGLIRDAIWIDVNGDNEKELLTVGEWQSPQIFQKENGQYVNISSDWGLDSHNGWWRSIEGKDLDNDGDLDLVIGNVGKNFKQKATDDYPLYLFSNDFDDNGTLDCVLAKPYKDRLVPTRGKECSTQQMPFVSEKFKTYSEFAAASVGDIYGEDKLNSGIKLEVNNFYSYVLWNEGDKFRFEKLPPLAQISPVNDIVFLDVNNDDYSDIIIVGNDYNTEYETPRLDAGNGLLLINKNGEGFDSQTISSSGIFCPGDAKRMVVVENNSNKMIVVANNNSTPNLLVLK